MSNAGDRPRVTKMTSTSTNCIIWDSYPGIEYEQDDPGWVHVESERAAGRYAIANDAVGLVSLAPEASKARLTTWLIDQRLQGVEEPKITREVVQYTDLHRSLPVHARADRLLRFVAEQERFVGYYVLIQEDTHQAYAWSESTNWREVDYFLVYLRNRGWLDGQRIANGGFHGVVTVTGYSRIADVAINATSAQVFVAMWFHESMDDAFHQGIAPAVQEAGYRPFRIDEKPDVVKIDDEIIAEIRRSRFLVADFTQYKREARGGVYYEAGFAEGIGIPVIYACHKDVVNANNLHFDTRQYAHIVWERPEELRIGLLNRIRARIGQGPIINTEDARH